MKKMLVHFYNQANLGDDLFIKILLDRYSDIELTIISGYKSAFRLNSSVKKMVPNFLYVFSKVVEKIIGRKNILFLAMSQRYDLFLLIGGSLFIEGRKDWSKERKFFKMLKIPYYILGSNIGPYRTQGFLETIKDIFKDAEDVCLRDNASYGLAEDVSGVRVATDIAFSLNTDRYVTKNRKVAIISIIDVSRKFNQDITEKYEHEIAVMTSSLASQGYAVIYMSFCKYEGDEDANKRVLGLLAPQLRAKVQEINYNGDIENILSVIASSEIVVGSRFHAVILGLLFGKKVLPMAYSDKTINILNDMNFSGRVIDIRDIQEVDSRDINFSDIAVENIEDQRKKAENQFLKLDNILVKKQ